MADSAHGSDTGGGRVLGLIPARGGSKGIPGKNLRPLGGKPLIWYTVQAARACRTLSRVVVSTDSKEIAEVARELGVDVPFLRPPHLATDRTPMVEVVKHAVAALGNAGWQPDIVVLLQPTAPLRRPRHIDEAVSALRDTGCDSVVSVVEVPRHLSPEYLLRLEDGRLRPFLPGGERLTRRQDARPAYWRDGTVYAFWRRTLEQYDNIYGDDCRPLLLTGEESICLDTLEDWAAAERRLG